MEIWDEVFRTEKIQLIFSEIDRIKQVGGAYAAILAHPQLIQTIIAIYDVLVDSFDDEHLFAQAPIFYCGGLCGCVPVKHKHIYQSEEER